MFVKMATRTGWPKQKKTVWFFFPRWARSSKWRKLKRGVKMGSYVPWSFPIAYSIGAIHHCEERLAALHKLAAHTSTSSSI